MINVFDNALEPHVAELIDMQLRDVSWKYNYDSVKNGKNKHWHIFCGHNPQECYDNGYGDLIPIWNFIKKHKPQLEMERVYLNAHTHGIEPHKHIDDGEFTVIYYPRMDWQTSWGGGTLIEGESLTYYKHSQLKQKNLFSLDLDLQTYLIEDRFINYIGNRLVMFTASNLHQAQPVSRECYELRTCVVFKTNLKRD